ncbi:MAG: cytochrome c oxidase subunit 4 [Nakamurella sp.]
MSDDSKVGPAVHEEDQDYEQQNGDLSASDTSKGLGVESIIFLALTGFFVVAGIIYNVLAPGEKVGIVALYLTAGLTFLIGSFLWFTGRRLDGPRPEDHDAEIAEGAGDLGFFSPGSYWPFTLAASAAVFAVATAFLLVWLMIIMAGLLLMSVVGLIFEYHRGPAAH